MKKILIVDDLPEIRELISVTLRMGDFEILEAEDGPQAVDIARKEKPDLILLDVMMPKGKIDGYQVCESLKKDPETNDIVIIMLTAKGQVRDQEKGFEVGANDYFIKPFSPIDLMKKVDDILSD